LKTEELRMIPGSRLAPPGSSSGQIVVVTPDTSGRPAAVFVDGVLVGGLLPESWLSVRAEPGERQVQVARGIQLRTLPLTVAPGERYWVEVRLKSAVAVSVAEDEEGLAAMEGAARVRGPFDESRSAELEEALGLKLERRGLENFGGFMIGIVVIPVSILWFFMEGGH
jgi:hypothetical protein